MMSTTYPDPPAPQVIPARRIQPDPQRDRRWRRILVAIAVCFLTVALLAVLTVNVVTWALNRGFTEIPASHSLGSPSSLVLDTQVADVHVIHDETASEVTVALVEPGATTLPEPGAQVRATVSTGGTDDARQVSVRQPRHVSPVPWEASPHDVLLVVPAGQELALELSSDVGDITAEGDFSRLAVTAAVGSVDLQNITAPDGVTVRADVGDVVLNLAQGVPAGVDIASSVGNVDLQLARDAAGDVAVEAEVGNVQIRVPGTVGREVQTFASLGDVQVAPGIDTDTGSAVGKLIVHASLGSITISR